MDGVSKKVTNLKLTQAAVSVKWLSSTKVSDI